MIITLIKAKDMHVIALIKKNVHYSRNVYQPTIAKKIQPTNTISTLMMILSKKDAPTKNAFLIILIIQTNLTFHIPRDQKQTLIVKWNIRKLIPVYLNTPGYQCLHKRLEIDLVVRVSF